MQWSLPSQRSAYAARGAGSVPSEEEVEAALRTWLDPQTIGHFSRSLLNGLVDATDLEMWEILAHEYDWGPPLLWLAQRVLCLPASEAQSEGTVGQVRRTLGDYADERRDAPTPRPDVNVGVRAVGAPGSSPSSCVGREVHPHAQAWYSSRGVFR
jgi:hypothetical protein